MAVTVTQVQRDNNGAVFHITATADADAAATITHGLGRVPRSVRIMPILSQALAALSAWTLDVPLGVTTVTLTKLATVGSGNAAVQLRVELDI